MSCPVEVGKNYVLRHSRKGSCCVKVLSIEPGVDGDATWVKVRVLSGHLTGRFRGPGEKARLRMRFCTFETAIPDPPATDH